MPTLPIAALMSLLLAPVAIAESTAADQPLLLDVFINGENIGKIGDFVGRGSDLLATKGELRSLGFRVQADLTDRVSGKPIGTPQLISLASIPGVTWRIDQETQSIYITVPLVRLLNTAMGDDTPAKLARRENPESSNGLTLNYDTNATWSRGVGAVTGLFDLRQYSQLGSFANGFITTTAASAYGRQSIVRLDTNFTRANPLAMRRFTAGDFISGSVGWSRSVRLEGVQIRSDFSTRPDLITFPLPTLRGSVAVPSSVQVFNDVGQAVSSQVGSGAFQVPQVPTITGAGTLTMAVTDATGQQVITRQSFYASSALLRPGLNSYSLDAGLTRLNWGLRSQDYGTFAAVGTFRRGITPWFTVETTSQLTPRGGMAGGGGVVKLGTFGTLDVAAAGSTGSNGTGSQLSASLERRSRFISMQAGYLRATSHFNDVASLNGDNLLRSQLTASASVIAFKSSSFGALYAASRYDAPQTTTLIGLGSAPNNRSAAITYTQQMGKLSAYVNAFDDLTGHQLGLMAGLVIPLGHRISANVSAGNDTTPTQLQVSRPAANVGDWGFQAFASAGVTRHVFGDVERRTEHGFVTAGVDSTDGVATLQTTSSGSVSFVDRGVFFANHIQDSFAVVDTAGLPNIRILNEQRVMGRSDRHGRLLVPDLRAYQANHLGIETSDVPLDITVNDSARIVRPRDRSGVVVRFATADNKTALVTLVDANGSPLPAGSEARLVPGGDRTPVGYDGATYLESLEAINRVRVDLPDGTQCYSEFRYTHLPGTVAKIGPIPCR